jgi:hypothetical protein
MHGSMESGTACKADISGIENVSIESSGGKIYVYTETLL